jgi:plastocyanin
MILTKTAAVILFAVAAHAATHTVSVEGMKFLPQTITVTRGDTVVWVNKDIFPHTATEAKRAFDSKVIAAGTSWTFTAKKVGTFNYICQLHPVMKGTIQVK